MRRRPSLHARRRRARRLAELGNVTLGLLMIGGSVAALVAWFVYLPQIVN